jgi:hypothetical protein
MGKSLFKSKMVWVNALTLAAGIVALVSGSDLIKDYPQAIAILAASQGALNVILRLFTTEPIK